MPDTAPIVTPLARELIREITDPNGARVVAVNSGIGSGKSYAIAQGVFIIAITRPGSHQLVSAGTYGLLMGVLKPRLDQAFGRAARYSGGTPPTYFFENGSRVELLNYRVPSTAASEASNPWEGHDCNALWVDEIEQLPSSVFDHSFQRCRLKARDLNGVVYQPTVVWIGRPGAVYHWIEKAEELRDNGRSVRTIIMPTASNPLLADDYLDNLKASMSREEYECVTQSVIGARMPVRGAIYSAFSPHHNLVDLTVDKALPTYCAIDFGVNTSAVLWIQEHEVNGGRAAVVVDEWCPDVATSTRDLVQGILARGWNLVEAICDPAGDARQRVSPGLVSEVKILKRGVDDDPDGLGGGLGCPVRAVVPPARRRVRDGILRVQARIEAADGTRALYVRRALWDRPEGKRGIRHSILQYEWDPATGEPRKGKAGSDADHAADCLRLYVIRRCWDGPPSIR